MENEFYTGPERIRTALITGGSRGIGAACARSLTRAGHRIIINYDHSEDAANRLAAELGCSTVKADVSDPVQVSRMFDEIGDVDILVCCAGVALSKLFTDTSNEEWRRILAVNLDGTAYCCKAAIPHMVHEKDGRIITVSSIWGVTGASCETAYSASKAGVIGLTKALAKELGPSGITVNCIAPGVIDTDMNASLSPETLKELANETPLCRIGTPEEVAAAVRFLASEDAAFITGQVLGVTGGFVI